jgi:hypothetical protein
MELPNTDAPVKEQEEKKDLTLNPEQADIASSEKQEKVKEETTTTETTNAPESDEHQESTTKVDENGQLQSDNEVLKEAVPVEEAELV